MNFYQSIVDRTRNIGQAVVGKYHLPGIAIGVTSSKNLICAEGFGLSDIEENIPMDPSTRQRIGSITKTMLGICVMSLVERGKISLDDHVKTFLPDIPFQGEADSLTIWNLMTHTGGIGEAPNLKWKTDPMGALWSEEPPTETVTTAYSEGVFIDVIPGTKWHYANHGFELLGEIISRVEGIPIEKVLMEHIFQPLQMNSTDCLDKNHNTLSAGYHREQSYDDLDRADLFAEPIRNELFVDGINIRGKYEYVRPKAAGFVQSNIYDMIKYAQCLLKSGFPIISEQSFHEMLKPQWCLDERLITMGLTFFRREWFGKLTFGHNGGITGGWNSNLTIIPEDDLAVIVHANINFLQFEDLVSEILFSIFGIDDQGFNSCDVDSTFFSQASGVYELPPGVLTNFRPMNSVGRVQIFQGADGFLYIKSRRGLWRDGNRLIPIDDSNDRVLMLIDTNQTYLPRIVFVKGENGSVEKIQFDRIVEMYKSPSLKPW